MKPTSKTGSEADSNISRFLAAALISLGLAMAAAGWILPQDQLGSRWLDTQAPLGAWIQILLWLNLRLVGILAAGIPVVILLLKGHSKLKLVASALVGFAGPLLIYLTAGLGNIIAHPLLSPRAGALLRPLGAASILCGGIVAYFSVSSPHPPQAFAEPVNSETRRPILWAAGLFSMAALTSSISIGQAEPFPWRHLFSMEFVAAAAAALTAVLNLNRERADTAAGLIVGMAAVVLFRSPTEVVTAILSSDAWAAGTALLALAGVTLALGTVPTITQRSTVITTE
jgi:hypothetical protein